MNLENLKVFDDLVKTESFSQAAKMNAITQSAVSQQLRNLEKELHTFLVDRHHKQFRLTPEGKRFHVFAQRVWCDYRNMQNEFESFKSTLSGTIDVSTIYSFGLHGAPKYLRYFLQNYPLVKVQLQYRRSGQIYDDILFKNQDLGIVAFPTAHADLNIIPLQNEPMVLVSAPQHPLAHRESISLADISGELLVAFIPGLPTRTATDAFLKAAGIPVQIKMEFDNIETVRSAVEIGAGLAFLPLHTLSHAIEKQTIKILALQEPTFHRPLAAMHRHDKPLSPSACAFVEILKATEI